MKRRLLFAILLIIVLAIIIKYGAAAAAAPISYDLPPETTAFRPGPRSSNILPRRINR